MHKFGIVFESCKEKNIMNKFKIILAFSLVIVMGLTACCRKEKINIEDFNWKLVELNGEVNDAFAENDLYTIMFLPEEERVAGVGAMNRFFGTYKIDGKNIQIDLAGTTMMAGPNMELETEMFDALKQIKSFELKKGFLLVKDSGKVVAKFKINESK